MNDLKIVRSILERHYSLEENPTYIFGSRAKNSHRSDSDLDILIFDKNIPAEAISYLNEAFEESNLTFKVDLVLRSRLDSDFFNNIKDSLVPIL